ncbi:roadblock/LC7 domain-containing protein [Frankia sp. CNm7]|uniref:Roadblock/LC7 domain-containing protein n=1 Tax=Frankia nepalensis TaxID=1836974 RepID=A0A937RME4_9ACTN|nr:roadblock/LC7 domain-containing protein [Frankia nepalensis]MBL7494907.1 roadblock/LC7 domain-containing protein [Frankia nepalensis]MBL7514427.1 roadblock/LC7 domain-containing protein [Frankia nepalensis]MBL7521175.1 roadblock/LC7 domain-containing protein [Frankia nepalensis]MBL7632900.1 roadblock/LC7 domain-containing protein [Frankia nepalensis]
MTQERDRRSDSDFSWLINDFVSRVHGVTQALIMSSDGLSLTASDGMSTVEGEQLAAIASGMLSLARNSAALFDKGTCENIIVRLSRGYFLFMGIDAGAGLAVLTGPDCDMKVVAYEMTQFVVRAGHALTPERRADLRRVLVGRRPE